VTAAESVPRADTRSVCVNRRTTFQLTQSVARVSRR